MSQDVISKEQTISMSITELKKAAVLLHPVGFYVLAKKLFQEGKKDESILWFYIGSIRYRYLLSSVDDSPFHPENEFFGKVQFEIGGTILDYAGGDPDFWAHQINEADKWDDEHINSYYAKDNNPEALSEVKSSIQELREKLIESKENIISQRIKNDAEVRVPHSGE